MELRRLTLAIALAAPAARADVTAPGEQPPDGAVPFRAEGIADAVSIGSARFRLHNLRSVPTVIEVARLMVGDDRTQLRVEVQSLLVTSTRRRGDAEPVIGAHTVRLAPHETIDLLVWSEARDAERDLPHRPGLLVRHFASFAAPPQPGLPHGFAVGALGGEFARDPIRSRGWDGERIRGEADDEPAAPPRPARNRRPRRAAPE